jgi:tRNA pseudouridine38-40 synthase
MAPVSGVTVLTLAYDGAPFHGFARQPGLETVQARLEDALRVALRRDVETVGAGRTDAGVHALGQVVSFETGPDDPAAPELLRSANALAGPSIVVTEVRTAPAGFSARHDAVAREYRYRLVPGPIPPLAIAARVWWTKGRLDLSAMREGASHLLGEHDFRSFCVADSADGRRTVRGIELIDIEPECQMGEHCITVRIVGRSFMHSMVRIVVGTLVEVGKGRRDPGWVAQALAACDRDAAGPTAPPQGLTLWHISYAEECWL